MISHLVNVFPYLVARAEAIRVEEPMTSSAFQSESEGMMISVPAKVREAIEKPLELAERTEREGEETAHASTSNAPAATPTVLPVVSYGEGEG